MLRVVVGLLVALLLTVAGLVASPRAQACDPGFWYHPDHQVCQPFPPPYEQNWPYIPPPRGAQWR